MPRHGRLVFPMLCAALCGALLVQLRPLTGEARAAVTRQADADHTIAVCAVPSLLNEMLESERFRPERDRLEQELNDKLQELRDRRDELIEDMEGVDPSEPEGREAAMEIETLGRRYQQLQMEAQGRADALFARQMTEAWNLIRSSAEAVAEDLGYDYVVTTAGRDEQLNQESSATALRQMLARPMIVFPEDADITDDVREDLNL
ncbi:MAG: OmpH family outer membrane protein [Phycisphaerales bacterium]|nr:OmpH family outer membrane protein [Phycisphaerales bacterium]